MPKQLVKQFITVNGVDICYDLADYTDPWSETQPEVFLLHHGYCRNMAFFQNWVPLLGRSFKILRFDARGYGDSGKPTGKGLYSIPHFTDDAKALLEALSIPRVHWVGESSGGIVGINFALQYPDMLSSLTLCNTPFKRQPEIGLAYKLGEKDQETAIQKFGFEEWCRQTVGYRVDLSRAPAGLAEWCVAQMVKTPPQVAAAMHTDIGKFDFLSRLKDIKTPTLLLASGGSRTVPEEQIRQMQEQMPQAKLVMFPEYGHGINLLIPERCVAEVLRFIGRSPPS